jgi:tetratricopeptide (TPR) repeat protein
MRTFILILGILMGSAATLVAAPDPAAAWKAGNACYQRHAYDSAAIWFEQIASLKPRNAEVYYNLGNAYYRLNKIAPAVLNYERALKIDPDFTDARDNLQLTQNRVRNHIQDVGDIFFIKWWKGMTHPSHSGAWAVTALLFFVIIIAVLALRRFGWIPGLYLPVQIAWVSGFFWMCFVVLAIVSAARGNSRTDAVVVQNDSPLLSSALQGKTITQVPEGTTVGIVDEKDNWVEVQIPDGRVGWMQISLLEKI